MIYFTLYRPIWEDVRLTTEDKLIANYVWQWSTKFEYSWANDATIAHTFGLDESLVSSSIAKLKSQNYIKFLDCEEGRCMSFIFDKYE